MRKKQDLDGDSKPRMQRQDYNEQYLGPFCVDRRYDRVKIPRQEYSRECESDCSKRVVQSYRTPLVHPARANSAIVYVTYQLKDSS